MHLLWTREVRTSPSTNCNAVRTQHHQWETRPYRRDLLGGRSTIQISAHCIQAQLSEAGHSSQSPKTYSTGSPADAMAALPTHNVKWSSFKYHTSEKRRESVVYDIQNNWVLMLEAEKA